MLNSIHSEVSTLEYAASEFYACFTCHRTIPMTALREVIGTAAEPSGRIDKQRITVTCPPCDAQLIVYSGKQEVDS